MSYNDMSISPLNSMYFSFFKHTFYITKMKSTKDVKIHTVFCFFFFSLNVIQQVCHNLVLIKQFIYFCLPYLQFFFWFSSHSPNFVIPNILKIVNKNVQNIQGQRSYHFFLYFSIILNTSLSKCTISKLFFLKIPICILFHL